MNKFRLLRADEIECRVSQCKERGCSILLYKTARTDADLLDEAVGPDHWTNDFKLVDGVLYGGIGIDGIWKWDAGTESNTEAEKGRASDAFKRAGFKWGIGRELYSAPFIWVGNDKCKVTRNDKTGKYQCFDNFEVSEIGYDDAGRINRLMISLKGETVYAMGKPSPDMSNRPMCADCGKIIRNGKNNAGEIWPANDIAIYTSRRFGRSLCLNCAGKINAD